MMIVLADHRRKRWLSLECKFNKRKSYGKLIIYSKVEVRIVQTMVVIRENGQH
jgi:hypothetical protein